MDERRKGGRKGHRDIWIHVSAAGKCMVVELMHVCGSRGPGGGGVLEGRCAKLQKGLPDGQGGGCPLQDRSEG